MSAWHPRAIRVTYSSIGSYIAAGHKCLWHTTEGFGLPRYVGSNPHFTLDPKTGRLWQHQPITEPSKALLHPPGTMETNRAHVIQTELIGFAAQTEHWSDAEYARIAALARWIEENANVPRRCAVKFTSTGGHQATRLGQSGFITYSGHLGHEHAASQSHWDPGRFLIAKVLGNVPPPKPVDTSIYPGVLISKGSKGWPVKQVQRWLVKLGWKVKIDGDYGPNTKHAVRTFQRHNNLDSDGVVGPKTWAELKAASKKGR